MTNAEKPAPDSDQVNENLNNLEKAVQLDVFEFNVTEEQPLNVEAEAMPISEDTDKLAVYSYTKKDGTTVTAASVEEARGENGRGDGCPYLAKLSLQEAKVILELSRKGQEMMAKASQKPEVIETVKEAVIAPKEKVPTVAQSKKTEAINTVETLIAPEIKTAIQEEYFNSEAAIASRELDTILKEVNETLLATKADQKDSDIENVITEKIVNKPVVKEIVSESVPQTSSLKEMPQPTKVIQVEQSKPIEINLHTEDKHHVEESIVPNVQDSISELIETQPVSKSETQLLPEVLTIVHEETESKVKTEAVFEQLIEMLSLPGVDYIEIDISPPFQDSENHDQEPGMENSLVTLFESYINDQPVEETVPTIDQIQAKAENQPIEESLGQLVSLIVEASTSNEALIAEIFELTEIFTADEEKTSVIKFDPEMLSKILSLLELIGYANPEKSLLDLVARYDLRFLISAMRYLHELTDPRNRQEFSISNFLKPIVGSVINPLAELLGKTVVRLMTAQ